MVEVIDGGQTPSVGRGCSPELGRFFAVLQLLTPDRTALDRAGFSLMPWRGEPQELIQVEYATDAGSASEYGEYTIDREQLESWIKESNYRRFSSRQELKMVLGEHFGQYEMYLNSIQIDEE